MPSDSTQALVVRTSSWRDYKGQLQRYARQSSGSPWTAIEEPIDVVLGRNGLGWGRGLHPEGLSGPIKREGDYRSPAGVFDLGEAHGYAPLPPQGTRWPYQQSGSRYRCETNPFSEAYNTFVPTPGYFADPSASPGIKRDVVFDLLIMVNHNTVQTQRQAGSCVLLHVWSGPGAPTQGCIAMSHTSLEKLLVWLEKERRPVLVQLPEPVLGQVGSDWAVPGAQVPGR